MWYSSIMQRTQISLSSVERALLDAERARTGRSMSALIRDAVVHRYGQADDHRTDLVRDLAALEKAAGAWQGRDVDGEEYVERLRGGSRWADVVRR